MMNVKKKILLLEGGSVQLLQAEKEYSPDPSKESKEKMIVTASLKTQNSGRKKTTEMKLQLKSLPMNESFHGVGIQSVKKRNFIIPTENLAAEPSNCTRKSESQSTEYPEKPEVTMKEFEDILKQSSSGDNCRWKLKSIEKKNAVFVLLWGCPAGWSEYTCTLYLHFQQINPNKSSIKFLQRNQDDPITQLGYRAFFHLISEKNVMHPICSIKTLLMLTKCSAVARKVETLMKDIKKLCFSNYKYKISYSVNPLRIDIDVNNIERESSSLVTCLVDLKSYPDVKIVPEITNLSLNDLAEEIQQAIALVEPGENYIFNIAKAANGR